MRPASFRTSFYETVQELTEICCGATSCERAVWSVEYLSRTIWYQFNGYVTPDEGETAAASLNPLDGTLSCLDPCILPFALLDFHDNAFIGAYFGDEKIPSQITYDMMRGLDVAPEIVSVSLARDDLFECGARIRTTTCFVFVGFKQLDEAEDIGSGKGLAASADAISSHWYRGRVSAFPPPLAATTVPGLSAVPRGR